MKVRFMLYVEVQFLTCEEVQFITGTSSVIICLFQSDCSNLYNSWFDATVVYDILNLHTVEVGHG